MRESCLLRVTIRYLLMFVHRRDLVQSSVSRTPSSDRVRERNAKSHLYTLLFFRQNRFINLIQKPSRFSHTGCGGSRQKKERKFLVLLRRFSLRKEHYYFITFDCSFLRPHCETRRFLSTFCGNPKPCGFDDWSW